MRRSWYAFAVALVCAMASSCGVSREIIERQQREMVNIQLAGSVGELQEHVFNCSVPGPSTRRMLVYLPEGYSSGDHRYPVLYLLHGARGHEWSWIENGGILSVTDSLFRNGLAVPCIVVMPNNNQYRDDADYGDSRTKGAMESIFEVDGAVESAFVNDVVSYVDSAFRTIPKKEYRAVAGLSVGGLQSRYISANAPDVFGYVGLFSPMFRLVVNPSPYNGFYSGIRRKQKAQFREGAEPIGYYYYVGKVDFFRPYVARCRRKMDRKGYGYESTLSAGGHDWDNWVQYYTDMLKKLFK